MAVKHEIKSQLAKLLATEDLVVEHRQVETAQFNVHTRVLTLPLWERASNDVYDMLVAHEVGHALFTPDQDVPKSIPHQYVNIVEDARIEKLMKRKYLGLPKTFYRGYEELADEDFFGIGDEDISKMNLADRANLWFKINNYTQIPIERGEEMNIINMISDCETFGDVLIAAEELYKHCKKEHQEKVADIPMSPKQGGAEQENQENQEQPDGNESYGGTAQDENSSDTGEQKQQNISSQSPSAGPIEEPEVKTVDSLDEKLRELVNDRGSENIYIENPKLNLDTVVIDNKKIHKTIDIFNDIQTSRRVDEKILFERPDTSFVEFKKSAQKEVNYLVKEFECRKSADAYARATTARTGVLDTSKLHTYKYNEDLFKKVSVIPDGKNHGLVFVLDWSGSMSSVLEDTLKQLYNLIWFCKKVSIPFEVYAFSSEWNVASVWDYEKEEYIAHEPKPHYEKRHGLLCVEDDFSMMNILTSRTSTKELEHQMLNIWRISHYYVNCAPYSIPNQLSLSGTPLNESIIALHQILPKFQSENKLQKVNCIILTDGEANHLTHHVDSSYGEHNYIGRNRINPRTTFFRDRKLGTTCTIDYEYYKFTDMMLENLKQNFPFINLIGIRIVASRDAGSFIRRHCEFDSKERVKMFSDWKKLKSFCIKNSGYDAYFGISSTALSQDAEFDVDEGATKAKIKSAFVKSLKTKKLNKKVLGEFISLVA